MIELIIKYQGRILDGGLVTILLFAGSSIIGVIGGATVTFLRVTIFKANAWFLTVVTTIIASCPIIVLLHWAFFPLQDAWSLKLSPFWTSILVLGTVNAALLADVFSRGAVALPRDYPKFAKMYGLPRTTYILEIWLPSFFVIVLPGVLIVQLTMLHSTLFAALIGTEEILRVALQINSVEVGGTPVFSMLALVFVLISIPFQLAASTARNFSKKIMQDLQSA